MRKIIGIGAGPSNLSLAALALKVPDITCTLLEQRRGVHWHSGLLLDEAGLQVSFLKDLVTPADPTNPLSFLNFLKLNGRLYQFLSANFDQTLRIEFDAYLKWAADQLPDIRFDQEVRDVAFDGPGLRVTTRNGTELFADCLSVAIGQIPSVPKFVQPLLGRRVFHSSALLIERPEISGETVVIVGSGQSAAETFLACLDGQFGMPASVTWLSRSPWFRPIDETSLTNEIFTPGFVDFFHDLPQPRREKLNSLMRFTSDGISPATSQTVMQRLYRQRYLEGSQTRAKLCPGIELIGARQVDQSASLTVQNVHNKEISALNGDRVILCTGYKAAVPHFMENLRKEMRSEDEKLVLGRSYDVQWISPRSQQVFISNGGLHSHGVSDPNLSLMATRAATILNTASCAKPVYDVRTEELIDWRASSLPKTMADSELASAALFG